MEVVKAVKASGAQQELGLPTAVAMASVTAGYRACLPMAAT